LFVGEGRSTQAFGRLDVRVVDCAFVTPSHTPYREVGSLVTFEDERGEMMVFEQRSATKKVFTIYLSSWRREKSAGKMESIPYEVRIRLPLLIVAWVGVRVRSTNQNLLGGSGCSAYEAVACLMFV
jgi:hypothetical protein